MPHPPGMKRRCGTCSDTTLQTSEILSLGASAMRGVTVPQPPPEWFRSRNRSRGFKPFLPPGHQPASSF